MDQIDSAFPESTCFGDVPFVVASSREAVKGTIDLARQDHDGIAVHFLNAYSVALAATDDSYADTFRHSVNFPDGKPLSWFTRLRASPLKQVRGPAFFEHIMDEGRVVGLRHFLLGGTQATLDALQKSLAERHPGVQLVGALSPAFRELTEREQVENDTYIASCKPDIVWVGLGTPKQDRETRRLAGEHKWLVIAVGAAFDFSAGLKMEAPVWLRKLGLEWLFRFVCEPRRLWRRYIFGNLRFISIGLRELSKDILKIIGKYTGGSSFSFSRRTGKR